MKRLLNISHEIILIGSNFVHTMKHKNLHNKLHVGVIYSKNMKM